MNFGRSLVLLLSTVIALSSINYVECSNLKRTRRSIENSDESATNTGKLSPRRRLTMADDVFTGTSREFEVIGYHRAVGAAVIKIISKFFGGIGSLINFTQLKVRSAMNGILNLFIGLLQSMQNTVAVVEPEPEPASTMSAIYDSISSVMYASKDSEEQTPDAKTKTASTPTNNGGQNTINKSASLRNQKNLPKATSGGALGEKSIMEDLARGRSSFVFGSEDSAVAEPQENILPTLPSPSRLASLLPTLVAGLVFTTAGTLVGYLYNIEWSAMAYSYADYFWGEGFNDAAQTFSSVGGHDDTEIYDDQSSSSAIPVTPDRF